MNKFKPGQTLKLKVSYINNTWGISNPEVAEQLKRRFFIFYKTFNMFHLQETNNNYTQNILYSEVDLNKYFELVNPIKTILPLP